MTYLDVSELIILIRVKSKAQLGLSRLETGDRKDPHVSSLTWLMADCPSWLQIVNIISLTQVYLHSLFSSG